MRLYSNAKIQEAEQTPEATKKRHRVGQESNGEGGSNDTPYERGDNRRNDSTKQSSVEKVLNSIGDSKNVVRLVVIVHVNVDGRDTGKNECTDCDADLATNQKGLRILIAKHQLAVAVRYLVLRELLIRKVDRRKQRQFAYPPSYPRKP